MISQEDKEQYKKIAEQIYLGKIKTHPLVGRIGEWIRSFMQEMDELNERIKKLEAEIELMKRSREDLKTDDSQFPLETDSPEKKREILLTPELISEIRLSFGCNVFEMAKILGMSPKLYCNLERGNNLPSFEQERKILSFRYMKAKERREVLQLNEIFVKSIKSIHRPRIPKPPETPEIRFPVAKLYELSENLQVSRAELAKLIGVPSYVVSNWFQGKCQPNEENTKKLKQLLKSPPVELPKKALPSKKRAAPEITANEISEILRELQWSIPEIAAYLHVSLNKVYHWTAGRSLPNRSQTNKLRELQDKIKIKKFDEIPVSIKEFSAIKEKLQYSDYHLSILLRVPFSRVHSWSLGVGAPSMMESKKLRSLHEQIVSGKFVDDTILPRISPEKIIEARKRQHLKKKEFMRLMGIRSNTYERWVRWKKGPTPSENERLWMFWEKPEPPLPRIFTAKEFLECRISHNLTQDKMADMLGVDRRQISRYELGITKIPFELSEKVRSIFNISFDDEEQIK